jgi:hypothetical protein
MQPLHTEKNGKYRKDGQLTEAGAKLIREAFAAFPEALPLLAKAAACPQYASPMDLSQETSDLLDALIKHINLLRAAARILDKRVDLLLFEKNREGAFHTSVDILRLGRHYEHELFITGYLVSVAVHGVGCDAIDRVLQDGILSAQSRRILEDELAQRDAMQGFVWCLKSERVFGMARFRTLAPRAFAWLFKKDECDYLDLFEHELRMGAGPRFKLTREIDAFEQKAAAAGVLSRMMHPALVAARDAVDRLRARMRCLRAINALQAYIERTGASPGSVAELPLPADAATDPFTGKPLFVKRTPQGWIIYSVGKDGLDDDGEIEDQHADVGAGPVPVPTR